MTNLNTCELACHLDRSMDFARIGSAAVVMPLVFVKQH